MNSKWWVVSSEIGTQDMKGEVNDGGDIPNDCSKPCPKRPRLSEIEKKKSNQINRPPSFLQRHKTTVQIAPSRCTTLT